ncbi:MAG: PH domain-containing protein [Actinomycetes bacterium]
MIWWPRLVVRSEGLEVRNVRTVLLPWADIKGVRVGSQLPLMGRFWQVIGDRAGTIGERGYPGLLVDLRGGRSTSRFGCCEPAEDTPG